MSGRTLVAPQYWQITALCPDSRMHSRWLWHPSQCVDHRSWLFASTGRPFGLTFVVPHFRQAMVRVSGVRVALSTSATLPNSIAPSILNAVQTDRFSSVEPEIAFRYRVATTHRIAEQANIIASASRAASSR